MHDPYRPSTVIRKIELIKLTKLIEKKAKLTV